MVERRPRRAMTDTSSMTVKPPAPASRHLHQLRAHLREIPPEAFILIE